VTHARGERAPSERLTRGVVVVSIGGEDRAEIIAEVVRQGLVNELIIDRTLSEALVKALA